MTPFLRWGVFAIIAVGALVFAYNASKDLAAKRPGHESAAVSAATTEPPAPMSATCEVEYSVAQRALEARANGDPVDRLLRMREISFQEDTMRRERLTQIARRWYEFAGEIDGPSLRNTVVAECGDVKPP